MRALVITADVRQKIAAAVAYAEANPIPWEELRNATFGEEVKELKLSDREPHFGRFVPQSVVIPNGFRAAFSVEEQPAGFLHHLSVSIDRPGKLPNVEALKMIAEAYGIKNWDRVWLEEFEPGHSAINILELYKPRTEVTP